MCNSFRVIVPFICFGCLIVAGCGGSGLVAVSGKAMRGDKPLSKDTVTFHPDAAKDNKGKDPAIGTIGKDGVYSLFTRQKQGAPPGWYKVTVNASAPPAKDADPYAPPVFIIGKEYLNAETTPLSIEVKENSSPGDYDLKLKAK